MARHDSAFRRSQRVARLGVGWGGFEVKFGGQDAVEQTAGGLLRFAGTVDTSKVGTPPVLGVITATGYG
ncbi:MAG TPA: hypothetical protein VFL10_07840 [Ornithinibacter sp.]|nr:hypothetical protein [Ornithinibacter sp.]